MKANGRRYSSGVRNLVMTGTAFVCLLSAHWYVAAVAQDTAAPGAATPGSQPVVAETQASAQEPTATGTPVGEVNEDAAASRLVVPAGESLKSTENSELPTTEVIVGAPTLNIEVEGEHIKLPSGETTETAAVKSLAELFKQIGYKPSGMVAEKGQREMDEPKVPTPLFDSQEARRLIQSEPTVLYRVVVENTPLPDPMIVPWIKTTIVLRERFEDAIDLLSKQQIPEGRQALLAIMTEHPETDYAVQARQLLKLLDQPQGTPTPIAGPAKPVEAVQTPHEVQINPNIKIGSVITDKSNPNDSIVFINGRSHRVGDAVQGYPNHWIVSISDVEVVFEVEAGGLTKQIPLPVRAGSKK